MGSPSLYMHLAQAILTPALTPLPFLPLDALEKLITADNVKAELTTRWYQKLFPVRPSAIVENAKKLFAILTLIGMSDKIWELLAEGMGDEHLPLSRHSAGAFSSVLLSADGKKRFQSFQKWNDARVNDFVTKQWVVQAPVFDVDGRHYTLNEHIAIPIVNSEEIESGQYSILSRAEFHPAHQSGFMTKNGNLRVAIKEFRGRHIIDFHRKKIREIIYDIHHQHLIQHYATFQWSDRYCVIFPWADGGNLSTFWKQNDHREKTIEFTTWSLRQMHGLAAALEALHNKNCRHGDLKPDSILYFNQLEEKLVIADAGVFRYHKEVTMLRNERAEISTTVSYQAPEAFGAPDSARTRRYDIWSLGCILLEFLVWYLHNSEAVEAFRKSRITGDSSYFYKHFPDDSFRIHPKVVDKISALQADTRCQENAFGDLLALIKDHMLQIEVQERHNADQISMQLHEILHMAESDPTYLMNISGLVEAVSDGLPSLTTGQTAESVEKKPELMSNKEFNDNDSEMSEVRGVSTEDQDKITTGFTEEITKRIQDLLLKFSSSPLPQKRFQHVFAKKLRQFSHNLVKDIPRTVEARRKRNAAKLISKRRNEIAAQSIRMLFPTEETDIKATIDIGIQDLEPKTHDRIHLMDRPVVDDESWLSDACEDEMPGDLTIHEEPPFMDLESEHTAKQYQANTLDDIAISRYLTSSKEFSLLDSELESLAKHYCSDVMGLIQRNVLERIGSNTKKGSTILFQVTWNLRKFVHEQFQTTLQDIGHILTITGNCCDAYLTTIDVYFEQTWPSHSRILLRELQKAVLGNIDNELPVIHSDSSNYSVNNIEVSFTDGVVLAKVSGSHNFIYTIGQQLAWLGAVCRDQEDGLVYCDTICTIQDQISDNELGSLFTFEYSTSQFDEDETKPCWHRLIGNMTVATGFPVPDRPDEEQGLQIPIEIMASLGHVLVLDDFGSGIILKGDVFDFLPISRKGNNVQWHLVDSAQNALQEYESTEGSSRLSQDKLPLGELSITTVFLGWTQHITNNSGTEAIDYAKIEWARSSQTSETSVKLTGFSFNLSYIFGSTATFTVGQKQYAREVRNLDNYDEIIRDLQDRSVVLYDTLTHRGWLLDAKRATLQILLHRYQTRKDSKCIDLGPFHQPINIHSVMNENRGTKLWEDWDSIKNVKKDVYFATEVKNIREKLVGLSFQAQAEYQRLNTRKNVIGFEYRDLVETPENLQALTTDLHSSCGEWPKVAHRQLSATVLFGKNFQEIFTPKENAGLCSHCQRMPGDKSYLAVETETIRDLLQKKALSLVSNDSIFSKCEHLNNNEYDCAFVRAQAIRVGTTMNDKVQQDIDSHAGAIIIGELTPRQTSVSKGTGQKSSKRVSGKDTVRRFWRTQISLGQSSLKKSVS